jgi:hypothetical protein
LRDRTYREQHRVVSRLSMKGGGYRKEPWEWPAECVEALDAYVPQVRRAYPPHSTKEAGPLLTSWQMGRALTADTEPRRIVRRIAELHPGLAELAPRLSADGVALSPSPFEDDEEPAAAP